VESSTSSDPPKRSRLRADDRRRSLIDAATQVFAELGYRGASTTKIAKAAGVTQPLLYRHFAGKADIYIACLSQAWGDLREAWETALAGEPNPSNWLPLLSLTGMQSINNPEKGALWIRSIGEASDDPNVHDAVAKNLREAHDFLTDAITRAKDKGGIAERVVPSVEAWTFIATGLLLAANNRLGSIEEDDIWALLRVGHERTMRKI
jgi:AcrR family transcriptional regulator